MPKRLEHKIGDILGNNIIFLSDIDSIKGRRYIKARCHCGKEFTGNYSDIKQNKIKSCGCLNYLKRPSEYSEGDFIGSKGITFIKDLATVSNDGKKEALFKCHCGVEFKNLITVIKNDEVISCGCSKGKSNILQYYKNTELGNYNIKYIEDVKTTSRLRKAKFECHCGNIFKADLSSVKRGHTTSCGCTKSKPEAEVKSFIQSLNIPFKANDRTVIKPKELDLIIPSHNLAIEFNGLFWHSELQGKTRNYHLDKTKQCQESGYELIHIFEHQWKNKQEIVKDIIKKRLGLVDTKIPARKCEIKEIDVTEARAFLEQNHLQGYATATHKIGLYYNSELVSIMTFGKSRYDKKFDWELIRFANKLGTNVLGGASKILKYFRTKYQGSILSYCDISIFSGNLYKQLGFEYSHNAKPNYFYFDNMLNVYSRVSFQKHKLEDKLANFNPSLTEWENMLNNDFNRYWDCGNAVYTLK